MSYARLIYVLCPGGKVSHLYYPYLLLWKLDFQKICMYLVTVINCILDLLDLA